MYVNKLSEKKENRESENISQPAASHILSLSAFFFSSTVIKFFSLLLMGRGKGHRDVLSSIKVARNDAKSQSGGLFLFYFVDEKYFCAPFDGDRMSSSAPQIFVKLSHMIKQNRLCLLRSVSGDEKNRAADTSLNMWNLHEFESFYVLPTRSRARPLK